MSIHVFTTATQHCSSSNKRTVTQIHDRKAYDTTAIHAEGKFSHGSHLIGAKLVGAESFKE
jgi:hypothetical protein